MTASWEPLERFALACSLVWLVAVVFVAFHVSKDGRTGLATDVNIPERLVRAVFLAYAAGCGAVGFLAGRLGR